MSTDLITFDQSKVDLIKKMIAKDATTDELQLFLHQSSRMGLDPLAKQIYFSKRRNKDGTHQVTITTGIDGYRLIADRTGQYAGNDDPVFDNEESPRKATVTVYKIVGGIRCAYTASARWDQYYPGDAQGFMWRKMPHLMLGKCAEGLALRKAFPAELSGSYVKEEMEQAVEVVEVVSETPKIADKNLKPEGYDPQNRKMQDWLITQLKKHKVDEDKWDLIGNNMRGRPSSDLERVIDQLAGLQ